jgi:hypothetical protein
MAHADGLASSLNIIVARRAEPFNMRLIQERERRHSTSFQFKFSPVAQHSNARHHPPAQASAEDEGRRVAGRVHAVVRHVS